MATRRGTIRSGLYVLVAASPFDPPDWPDEIIAAFLTTAMPDEGEIARLKLLEYARSLGPSAATFLENLEKLCTRDADLLMITAKFVLDMPATERRDNVVIDIELLSRAFGHADLANALRNHPAWPHDLAAKTTVTIKP